MSPIAIALIVASAILHATWNLLSKRRQPASGYFLLANLAGVALLSPVVLVYRVVLQQLTLPLLGLLALTGVFQATYYGGLARAYRAGDISVAYPLARSSPVLMVTAASFLAGRGSPVSGVCIAGMLLVVCGCALVPMHHLGDLRWRTYANPTCAFALVAAVGTAGYSLVDDLALRLLRDTPARAAVGVTGVTLVYAWMEGMSTSVCLFALSACRPAARQRLRRYLANDIKGACLAGGMIYLTYSLVLTAMAFVTHVSYVVAFRQLSIPLGAVFGVVVLREPAYRPKALGVAIVLGGLVLVATG